MNEQTRVLEREKRRKAKKRKKAFKNFLIILGVIIIAVVAFVITVKVCKPDFDFKTLIPQKVSTFVDEKFNKTKTTTVPTTTSAPITTTKAYFDYLDSTDFAFNTSRQGNQLGNLLNKSQGKITHNSSYNYIAVTGSGIYRFAPNEETTTKVTDKFKNIKCLNVIDSSLYFIDLDTNNLVLFDISTKTSRTVAKDISFIYLYNTNIYYVTIDMKAGYLDISNSYSDTLLYTAAGGTSLNLSGISLTNVFLVEFDPVTNIERYITVSLENPTNYKEFKEETSTNAVVSLQIENGFMYYYLLQDDNTYDLVRQKFGSKNTVTLVEEATNLDFVTVYQNRLYYSSFDGNKIKAKELNMNSMSERTMLTQSDTDLSGTLSVGYGYQYVYLVGTKTSGSEEIYKGTCIYTSSSKDNIMSFKDGKWKY